jgi:mannose-6-phosphate isomerase
MQQLPPLKLERKLDSRIWGGNTLGTWLGLDDAPPQLAESWQVYAQNRVLSGPFAGRSLAELSREYGAALVGTRSFARYGGEFPLLAKFIDAADDLSVQVHPDDAYARQHEAASGFLGKTEAWYILQATPGSHLIHGLNAPSDRESFAAAVANGTLMDLLRRVAVQPGDAVFVPAGTVHAISGGILLFEIQQTSDLTYRVYDYDRRDAQGNTRELHLERALDVIDYGHSPEALAVPQDLGDGRTLLVECPFFAMERWQLDSATSRATDLSSFVILTSVDGAAEVRWNGEAFSLQRGESIVLPASLGAYELVPQPAATVLACFVPS